MDLAAPTAALKQLLDGMPGAVGAPMASSRGSRPLVLIYKIMGKMFAILSVREEQYVILKCDAFRAEILRETYSGIGHRSHLDPRNWISVDLAADVPEEEIEALVRHSWDEVAASLTRKQRAALALPEGEVPL